MDNFNPQIPHVLAGSLSSVLSSTLSWISSELTAKYLEGGKKEGRRALRLMAGFTETYSVQHNKAFILPICFLSRLKNGFGLL